MRGGIERAVSKYEDDGLVALSRAVARRVGRRTRRLQRNVRWHLEHPGTAVPDPGRVYAVSPSDVEYLLEQNALRDRIGGQVRCDVLAGDWDLLETPLRETYIYDSLRARFVEGTARESTTYCRKIVESDGEPYAWNGQILGEVEDPLTWLERYDAHYADVNENGYDGSHPVEVHSVETANTSDTMAPTASSSPDSVTSITSR